MHLLPRPPASGRGRRLRRWRRWSAHRPAAACAVPATRAGSGTWKARQHIAPPRLGARPWRPGWAWGGCGSGPAVSQARFQSPRQARAPVPPPGCSAAARAASGAAAPARSGRSPPAAPRPPRPSQRAKPGTRSSRSACFSARIGAAAVLVIGAGWRGRVSKAGGVARQAAQSVSPSSATAKGNAAAGADRAIQKGDRAPAIGAEAAPAPPARGRRCRAAETADPAAAFRNAVAIAASLAAMMPQAARLFSIFRTARRARRARRAPWRRPLPGPRGAGRPGRPAGGGDAPFERGLWIGDAVPAEICAASPRDWTLRGFRCARKCWPPADGPFDLAVSLFSLQWINDLPGALIQIRRAAEARRAVPGGAAGRRHPDANCATPSPRPKSRPAAASARACRPSPMCATWAACCSGRALPCRWPMSSG